MPSTTLRQQVLMRARKLVVKIGSQLLTNSRGELDTRHIRHIGDQVAELIRRGYQVTLVSSGAIAVGRKMLELPGRPKDIAILQGVAAIGQTGLMNRWHKIFARHGLNVGQILLTRDDFEDRTRYLNLRNCLLELPKMSTVPIINENDAVAVDEIRLGDNDVLAALVANAMSADALILLSVVEGLKNETGEVIDLVDDFAAAAGMVDDTRSTLGTGGMGTKLQSARTVTEAGEIAVVAGGRVRNVLLKIAEGQKVGTVFAPSRRKLDSRQRWIGQAVRPAGTIVVDDGAAQAIAQSNRSLLATGIMEVVGQFQKGDVVVVRDTRGHEIARGLINYNADETRQVKGQKTSQLEKTLHRRAYDEVIHRDNLVVTAREGRA
jgi:glutamate 5-kinase